MARTLIILVLLLLFLLLLRRRLIHVDLSFPWFVAIIVLGFVYNNPLVEVVLVKILVVAYPIYAVLFLTLFILFGLVTAVLIMVTRDHRRQVLLLRGMARLDLARQEAEFAGKRS